MGILDSLFDAVGKIATAADKSPEEVRLALEKLSFREKLILMRKAGQLAKLQRLQKDKPTRMRSAVIDMRTAEIEMLLKLKED